MVPVRRRSVAAHDRTVRSIGRRRCCSSPARRWARSITACSRSRPCARAAFPLRDLLFVGEPHADNEATIPALGRCPQLGRLPPLDPLDAGTLAAAMRERIDLAAIRAAMGLAA